MLSDVVVVAIQQLSIRRGLECDQVLSTFAGLRSRLMQERQVPCY